MIVITVIVTKMYIAVIVKERFPVGKTNLVWQVLLRYHTFFKLFISLGVTNDLVYFATRLPDTSNTSAKRTTRVGHKRHECNTSTTQMTQVRHEWNILILITTQVKTYFHTPILAIWQIKDYKKRNNFIRRTTLWTLPHPKMYFKLSILS